MALLTLDPYQLTEFVHSQIRKFDNFFCVGWPTVTICEFPSKEKTWAGSYTRYGAQIRINATILQHLEGAVLHRALRSILLHELCHHWVEHSHNQAAPHGREFRAFATQVNAIYGEEVVTTYHDLRLTPEGDHADRLQRRARALLALAHNGTQHEAELAAARFAELAARFNLQLDPTSQSLAADLPPCDKEIVFTAPKLRGWHMDLCTAVARSFCCTALYRSAVTGCRPAQVEFIGRPRAIDQAIDLLLYLLEAVERQVAAHRKELGATRPGLSYWHSYRTGIAMTLATRLRDQDQQRREEGLPATPEGDAPIPALVYVGAIDQEWAATDEAVAAFYPKLGTARRASSVSNGSGYRQGSAAGRSISLARQVRGGAARALAGAA